MIDHRAEPAAARDLYVDNVLGDDGNDGRSANVVAARRGPVRSIARALELARRCDNVILANHGVPYRESATLAGGCHSGTPRDPFLLVGNGAVLDGRAAAPANAWTPVERQVFRFRPRRGAFQRLFLKDNPLPPSSFVDNGRGYPTLAPGEWTANLGWVYFCVDQDRLPEDYDIAYAAEQTGLTLYNVRNVVVMDLALLGYQLDGVNAHDGARDCRLVGLVARWNGRAGISIGGASSVQTVECVAADNAVAQLRTEAEAIVSVEQCELSDQGAPAILHAGGRLFVDGERIESSAPGD